MSLAFVVLVLVAVQHKGGGSNPAAALAVLTVPFIVIFGVGAMYARRFERTGAPERDGASERTGPHLSLLRGPALLLAPLAALVVALLSLLAGDRALAIVCAAVAVVGLLVAALTKRKR